MMASQLVQFYRDGGVNSEKRTLQEIQGWPFNKLEAVHNYIQWLFPLNEPSAFNRDAPLLTAGDIDVFRSSEVIKENLLLSFKQLMLFYGYSLKVNDGKLSLEKSSDFEIRSQNWLQPHNHNFLRITRIIKCLKLLGFDKEAVALFDQLKNLYNSKYQSIISPATFRYWELATR
jgi:hypothetical protein